MRFRLPSRWLRRILRILRTETGGRDAGTSKEVQFVALARRVVINNTNYRIKRINTSSPRNRQYWGTPGFCPQYPQNSAKSRQRLHKGHSAPRASKRLNLPQKSPLAAVRWPRSRRWRPCRAGEGDACLKNPARRKTGSRGRFGRAERESVGSAQGSNETPGATSLAHPRASPASPNGLRRKHWRRARWPRPTGRQMEEGRPMRQVTRLSSDQALNPNMPPYPHVHRAARKTRKRSIWLRRTSTVAPTSYPLH